MRRSLCATVVLFLGVSNVSAYDTETHAWLMHQAYLKSNLASVPLRERLGFDRLDEATPFRVHPDLVTLGNRDAYLDLLPGSTFGVVSDPYSSAGLYRAPTEFERQRFVYTNGPALPVSNSGLYPTPFKIEAALVRGVVREDDLLLGDYGDHAPHPDTNPYGDFRHVANHFFDPVNDRPLELGLGVSCDEPLTLDTPCNKSIDWGMGVANAQTLTFNPLQTRRNHFTWLDAREAFWRALTYKSSAPSASGYAARQAQDSGIRRNFWHTSLKSIGHVSHLLQDSAQPQHTRNDRHNPGPFYPIETTLARRTMEFYANYRVTGNTSSVSNDEQTRVREIFNFPGSAQLLTVPPIGTYPIPQFSIPVKFFTTRTENPALASRRGLADYSNRGFYSEGTLPDSSSGYTSPPTNLADPSFTVINGVEFSVPGLGTLAGQKLLWAVPDAVAPTYPDTCVSGGKLQLVSVGSLFAFGDISSIQSPGGMLALDDYKCHQDALLPRAIAYSAGLVNHFFRGELEIAAPPQRVLGAIDQGVSHTVDAEGYPRRTDNNAIFGFHKLRLRVRNITADIVESGSGSTFTQTLGGSNGPSTGRMVAVARYHRNPCYKPDMTGERRVTMPFTGTFQPPSGCTAVGSRTRYQEISVSAEVSVAPGELGFGTASAFVDKVFDFANDPIPVNATDLFVQVVYRGPLGAEPDGLALGTYDAREPMFVTYWNNSDYFNQNGNWASAANATQIYRKGVKDFQLCAGAGADRVVLVHYMNAVTGLAAMGAPEPAGFMRFAVIAAKPVSTENVVFRGNASFFDPQPPSPYLPNIVATKGTINQANKEQISLATVPFPLAAAPLADCPATPAPGSFLWCVEPIQVRRGLNGGKVDEAVYLANSTTPPTPPDPGTLPAFTQAPVQRSGTNLWELPTLTTCPNVFAKSEASESELLLLKEQLAEWVERTH